jgi:hypothetical protein
MNRKTGKRFYELFTRSSGGNTPAESNEVDHAHPFSVWEQLRGDFLLTYDNADEVRALALRHGFEARLIAMKNTHHAEMTELLIGRDLRWMEGSTGVVA